MHWPKGGMVGKTQNIVGKGPEGGNSGYVFFGFWRRTCRLGAYLEVAPLGVGWRSFQGALASSCIQCSALAWRRGKLFTRSRRKSNLEYRLSRMS